MIKFTNSFKEASRKIIEITEKAVEETAQKIVKETSELAPRKTGELAESYTYVKTGVASVEIGSPLERAIKMELLRPHLTPAAHQNEQTTVKKFKEKT